MAILLTNSIATAGICKTITLLKDNESSLDAIESGIRLVESDPNASWVGYGGHPNLLGKVELDAGIMEGASLHSGSVGALSGYSHPISVARKVMEKLPHVFWLEMEQLNLQGIVIRKLVIICRRNLVKIGKIGLTKIVQYKKQKIGRIQI